jgi:glycosyltransferase involved in cell wall biosynthesis
MPAIELSVVIIGRNEGERLVACIQSVKKIPLPPEKLEIIYVDSASTDDSPTQAAALGATVLRVQPERPAAAIGRNAGWRAAHAPYILFLDGDTLLHPDFYSTAQKEFTDSSVAVVWGHRRERYPERSLYQRVLDLDWVYPAGLSEFCGGDALMQRHVLEEIGGYDPHLIAGEEPEMCQRMRHCGYKILHIDAPMTLHDLAITRWGQYWRRAVRAGYAYAEISQRFKQTAHPLWSRDAKKNLIHAAILMGVALFGVISSLALGSILPSILSLLFYSALVIRSAWKVRWKSQVWMTLLLYGIHSHLQQIPIAMGQLSYYYNQLRGTKRQLIEYK